MKLEYSPFGCDDSPSRRSKGVLTLTAESKKERKYLQAFAKDLQFKAMRHSRNDPVVNQETSYIKLMVIDAMKG